MQLVFKTRFGKCAFFVSLVTALIFGLGVGACGDDDSTTVQDDPFCDTLTQAQKDTVQEAIAPLVWKMQDPERALAGVDFVYDEQAMTATLTYDGYVTPQGALTLDGALSMAVTVSGDVATMTLAGPLTVTGGEIETLTFDLVLTLPWDETEEDFAGPPSDTAGTVSIDEHACDAARFPNLFYVDDPPFEPHFVVAAMQGAVVLSENGSVWEDVVESGATGVDGDLFDVACDTQGHCVAVGDEGTALHSSDMETWTNATTGVVEALAGVAVCDGSWLAVGHAGVALVSNDSGETWSAVESGVTDDLFAVDCASGAFVMVGANGTISEGGPTEGFGPPTEVPIGASLRAVANDTQGNWVAVGDGGAVLSADDPSGVWNVSGNISESLSGLAFGQGRFVAVGQGPHMGWGQPPVLYVSEDGGQSWSPGSLPNEFGALSPPRPLGDVATDGQGRWSALGNGGDHLLSTDNGDSWQVIRLDYYGAYGIAYRP